ncbi:MFS transporter [Solicola gregarius]|uniref:MFS transporter n=1 Tax=Solicola gregarius TaxID=2908642 RepID=A0AA46YP80_9ACTN|nr:MFS transporter [Solicola gregarius]UYM07348.1 MFS transporter [Solicola gregarius]
MSAADSIHDGLWTPGFRRLLAARLTSQCGDGVFQAGIAWLVLLSPDAQRTPASFVGVLALLLLPFSIVGPFAGVVLDRWRRRQILFVGQLLRVAAVCAVAFLSGVGGQRGTVLAYALVLVALGINRLLLAALSASVPYVVRRGRLVDANAIGPTAGTVSTGAGLAIGALVIATSATSSHVLLASTLVFVAAALIAKGFAPEALGPGAGARTPRLADAVVDLRAAYRHLSGRPRAWWALVRLGAFRFAFGWWAVWVFAETAASSADADAAASAIATAAGIGAAAVLTPLAARRWALDQWVRTLAIAMVAVALASAVADPAVMWAIQGFAFGIAGQTLKIQTDTIVQREVDESFLGRTFTLYDVTFNVTFVAGSLIGAIGYT